MSGNSIGQNFVVTTFGESHGVALGCVVDGCPPGMELDAEDIQADLFDRILAMVPEFGLKVFQEPAGSDLKRCTEDSR